MKSTITIRLGEIEKEVIKNYVNNKSLTISEFIKKIILDYIEDEYDLKVYKEYLKEKENGPFKTYSHKEVWGK